jgi:hypothetical protein
LLTLGRFVGFFFAIFRNPLTSWWGRVSHGRGNRGSGVPRKRLITRQLNCLSRNA